jgi:hypothetical protein
MNLKDVRDIWQYIPIRWLSVFNKVSLFHGTWWAVFEPIEVGFAPLKPPEFIVIRMRQ